MSDTDHDHEPGSPSNSNELVRAILRLDVLEPVERARAAAALIQPAQQILGAIRKEAIYEATRTLPYQDVARRLDVKEATINVAISDHKRAEKPTHHYGRCIAVARATAELAAEATKGTSVQRFAALEQAAMGNPTRYTMLVREVERWLTAVDRHDKVAAAAMRHRIVAAEAAVITWITATQRHLTAAECGEVTRGYSNTLALQRGAMP